MNTYQPPSLSTIVASDKAELVELFSVSTSAGINASVQLTEDRELSVAEQRLAL